MNYSIICFLKESANTGNTFHCYVNKLVFNLNTIVTIKYILSATTINFVFLTKKLKIETLNKFSSSFVLFDWRKEFCRKRNSELRNFNTLNYFGFGSIRFLGFRVIFLNQIEHPEFRLISDSLLVHERVFVLYNIRAPKFSKIIAERSEIL